MRLVSYKHAGRETWGSVVGDDIGDLAPRYLKPGDVIEVEIEKIGTLRNPVIAQS